MQKPLVPGSAHDLQVLVQEVAQQIPWAQNPDAHSLSWAHDWPMLRLP